MAPTHEEPPYLMYELDHPLIKGELLDALRSAGVSNLESFPALLHHPSAGLLEDYFAFNVVGMVATSSLAAQLMADYVDLEFETDEIEGLESDYSLIPSDVLLARFADRIGRIIVRDDLRRRIDPDDPESGLVFFDLEGEEE